MMILRPMLYTNKFCVNCGIRFESDDKFCKECGIDREKAQILDQNSPYQCKGCKTKLGSDFKYCPNCGWRSEIPSTIRRDDIVEEKLKVKKKKNYDYVQEKLALVVSSGFLLVLSFFIFGEVYYFPIWFIIIFILNTYIVIRRYFREDTNKQLIQKIFSDYLVMIFYIFFFASLSPGV